MCIYSLLKQTIVTNKILPVRLIYKPVFVIAETGLKTSDTHMEPKFDGSATLEPDRKSEKLRGRFFFKTTGSSLKKAKLILKIFAFCYKYKR